MFRRLPRGSLPVAAGVLATPAVFVAAAFDEGWGARAIALLAGVLVGLIVGATLALLAEAIRLLPEAVREMRRSDGPAWGERGRTERRAFLAGAAFGAAALALQGADPASVLILPLGTGMAAAMLASAAIGLVRGDGPATDGLTLIRPRSALAWAIVAAALAGTALWAAGGGGEVGILTPLVLVLFVPAVAAIGQGLLGLVAGVVASDPSGHAVRGLALGLHVDPAAAATGDAVAISVTPEGPARGVGPPRVALVCEITRLVETGSAAETRTDREVVAEAVTQAAGAEGGGPGSRRYAARLAIPEWAAPSCDAGDLAIAWYVEATLPARGGAPRTRAPLSVVSRVVPAPAPQRPDGPLALTLETPVARPGEDVTGRVDCPSEAARVGVQLVRRVQYLHGRRRELVAAEAVVPGGAAVPFALSVPPEAEASPSLRTEGAEIRWLVRAEADLPRARNPIAEQEVAVVAAPADRRPLTVAPPGRRRVSGAGVAALAGAVAVAVAVSAFDLGADDGPPVPTVPHVTTPTEPVMPTPDPDPADPEPLIRTDRTFTGSGTGATEPLILKGEVAVTWRSRDIRRVVLAPSVGGRRRVLGRAPSGRRRVRVDFGAYAIEVTATGPWRVRVRELG